jgi:hypothetical protein
LTFRHPTDIQRAVDDLEKDLLRPAGPQISTVRNYNFAILPYAPEDEFALRHAVHELSGKLRDDGWTTGTVVLHSLLLARLRLQGEDFRDSLIRREKSLAGAADPTRGLRALKERIVTLLEGPDGLAADVIRAVEGILGESSHPDRTVVFLGRAGALYPFFRSSALLKHVAGHTRNVPVAPLSGARRGRHRALVHGRPPCGPRLPPPYLSVTPC